MRGKSTEGKDKRHGYGKSIYKDGKEPKKAAEDGLNRPGLD